MDLEREKGVTIKQGSRKLVKPKRERTTNKSIARAKAAEKKITLKKTTARGFIPGRRFTKRFLP